MYRLRAAVFASLGVMPACANLAAQFCSKQQEQAVRVKRRAALAYECAGTLLGKPVSPI
jgi:hypothetical protein